MKKINYLAIIPARRKSKRIKNKNIKYIKKKILFDYTLEAAKNSNKIDQIIITTNIKRLLKNNSKKIFYVKRPDGLSKDVNSTESAITHCLDVFLKEEDKLINNIVLLQPTSPFRNAQDIDGAINEFEKKKNDSLFSAYTDKLYIWRKKKNKLNSITYDYNKRKRSQVMEETIVENGAIFIFNYKKFLTSKVRLFGNIGCFLMSNKNSVEIDTDFDLSIARLLSKS